MESNDKIYNITPKGALLVALCETFGMDITEAQVNQCYTRFCEILGVDQDGV